MEKQSVECLQWSAHNVLDIIKMFQQNKKGKQPIVKRKFNWIDPELRICGQYIKSIIMNITIIFIYYMNII